MNTTTARVPNSVALPRLSALIQLFKLRSVGLLVLASLGGALLASGGRLAIQHLILLVVTGTLSSAGASAINQYLEREQDTRMRRTRGRLLTTQSSAHAHIVLGLSTGMIVLAFGIALAVNPWLALFVALGALIYVGVYTMWLKPRTILNIVIGGAAGSCTVLSGSAAAGDWSHPTAVALALLVFVWTPVHFWSLAQAHRDDYASAGIPMLPIVTNARATARWIVLHAAATAIAALLLSVDPKLGWLYLAPVGIATLWLAQHSARLMRQPQAHAIHLFKCSNIYLGLVLLAIYCATLF